MKTTINTNSTITLDNGIIIPVNVLIDSARKAGYYVKPVVKRTVADYNPIDIENGEKFRKIRGKLSQKEFGKRIGYSAAHVSCVERGYCRATGKYTDSVYKAFIRKPSIDFKEMGVVAVAATTVA